MWKRGHYIALIVKIRQICTSPNGHQWPLNRGCFQHIVYPVWTPERLPEREYEGRFFPTKVKPSWKQGNHSIVTAFIQFPRHPYPILHPIPDHKCRQIPTHLIEIQKTGTSSPTPGPPSRGPRGYRSPQPKKNSGKSPGRPASTGLNPSAKNSSCRCDCPEKCTGVVRKSILQGTLLRYLQSVHITIRLRRHKSRHRFIWINRIR